MRLLALVLVVILAYSDAVSPDPDCEDCHENGAWYPLFHPSQIINSEFPEHEQYRSHESAPPLTYATARPQVSQEAHSQEMYQQPGGIDSPVNSYDGNGQHHVEWDHYGDVTTVSTVYNSIEERVGGAPRVSGEDRSDMSENLSGSPEQDTSSSVRSQEESFFDNASFFDERQSNSFPEDFDVANMYTGENHHHGNSIEEYTSPEYFAPKKPIPTSYASISSVFESRPVPRARDLLHPTVHNNVPHYIDIPRRRSNRTKQYLVHEAYSREDPGLQISREEIVPRNKKLPDHGLRPTSYVPVDHPVYRYVKVHGGLNNNKLSQSRSTLHLEDIHPRLRSKFPFKYLKPRVQVQKQETFVRHVMPTEDPFSDSFWRESQKMENLKPPPNGQTLYYFKKKPNPEEIKSITRRRQSPSYMYIIRRKN